MNTGRQWGFAWLGLTAAFAVHVVDEVLTGFLPVYNSLVFDIREAYPLVPLPTFTFPVWLGGLITGVILLFMLARPAFAGRPWLRYISYPYSVIMILNGLGHIAASVYWGFPAPGLYSSPLLILAAVVLLVSIPKSGARSGIGG